MPKAECPQPFDIEPTCFEFNAQNAWNHARGILSLTFPEKEPYEIDMMIEPAVAFVVPSAYDASKYLYGKRSPDSDEFPNAWGLPSTSITKEQIHLLDRSGTINPEIGEQIVMKLRQKKGELTTQTLNPQKIIGWTGRLRGPNNGYDHDYYLIMVDIQTDPIDPQSVASQTYKYTEFQWLTADEHNDLILQSDSKACGACSALVFEYSKQKGNDGR